MSFTDNNDFDTAPEGRDLVITDENTINRDLQPADEPITDANGEVDFQAEAGNWKKRHGDTRRAWQQETAQKDAQLAVKDTRIAQLEDQLQTATTSQIRFPKTKEEVAEWAKQYPDVAAVVDTIAQMRATEAVTKAEKKIGRIDELQAKLNQSDAMAQLLALHPDFIQLRDTEAFRTFLASAPASAQKALNGSDVNEAAWWIQNFKDKQPKKGSGKKSSPSAAEAIPSGGKTTPSRSGEYAYSESMIEGMSDTEYEQHEEKIMAAMANNTFNYDISGGAR